MSSRRSRSSRPAARPFIGPREAVKVGPDTYVLRPLNKVRRNTWHRWKRQASAQRHSGTGLRCSDCGNQVYLCQLQFAHYHGAPKRLGGGRSSIFASNGTTRSVMSEHDIDELQHGRFLCANCHALETVAQRLGDDWIDDFVFTSAEAERSWFAARVSGVPRGPRYAKPLVQPLHQGQQTSAR